MSLKLSSARRKPLVKSGVGTKRTKRGSRKSIISGERPKHKGYRQLQESEQAAIQQVEALQKQLKAAQHTHRRDLSELKTVKNELNLQIEKTSELQKQQQDSERNYAILSSALEVQCCVQLCLLYIFQLWARIMPSHRV